MDFKEIILEKKNGIGKITINKPPVNVMSLETILEMISALEEINKDAEVKVVLITGAGDRAFSAGVEVKDHLGDRMPKMVEEFGRLFKTLKAIDKPTIAVVNGVALGGGCEVVAGCDMAIASERARFGQPEIKLGVDPPPAVVLFPHLMGRKKAFEIILSGDEIDAKEAKQIGLVNKVVSAEELEKEADEFASRFLDKSGLILGMTRHAIYEIFDLDFERAIEATNEWALKIFVKEDAIEGLTSFLEKRKPVWKNK